MSAESPTLSEVLRHTVETALAGVNTVCVGHVQAYDVATRTTTVVPATLRPRLLSDGTYDTTPAPALSDVPVLYPSGGGYEIVWPLEPGDAVLLLCSMVYEGAYLEKGQPGTEPGLMSTHTMSSVWAVPGVLPSAKVAPGEAALVLRKPTGALVHIDDVVSLGATGPAADFVALAGQVETALTSLVQAITAATAAGSPLVWVPPTIPPLGATKVKAV